MAGCTQDAQLKLPVYMDTQLVNISEINVTVMYVWYKSLIEGRLTHCSTYFKSACRDMHMFVWERIKVYRSGNRVGLMIPTSATTCWLNWPEHFWLTPMTWEHRTQLRMQFRYTHVQHSHLCKCSLFNSFNLHVCLSVSFFKCMSCRVFCAVGAAVHLSVSWGSNRLIRAASVEEIPRADSRNTGTTPQQQVFRFTHS